jgi:hypothetical protein
MIYKRGKAAESGHDYLFEVNLALRPGRRAKEPGITFEQFHQLIVDHGVDVEMR